MPYKFDRFVLDERTCQLSGPEGSIALEKRVFDLLAHLVRNRGRIVPKSELFRVVWSNRVVSEASLSVAIAALRRALGDDAAAPKFIATHHGRGYRFCLETTDLSIGSACTPNTGTRSDLFVGRERNLESLLTLLASARGGHLQIAVISGEPGIGKSRLVDSFVYRAVALGNCVLSGRSPEEPGAPAFWPWIQVLREYFAGASPASIGMLLSGIEDIIHIVPELRDRLKSSVPPTLGDAHQARFRLFDSIARCLSRAAKQQHLTVVLEDIHRADEASLLLLTFLATALAETPLMIVATYRDTARSPLLNKTLSSLARSSAVTTDHLEGFDSHDCACLLKALTSRTPSQATIDALHNRTRGNPFFLSQLAPYLERGTHDDVLSALPEDLVATVAAQVDDLPQASHELLTIAAVIGSDFSLPLLAAATGTPPQELLGTLQVAIDSRAIVAAKKPAHYRFRHSLVRDALYHRLGAARRAVLHERVGQALDRLFGNRPGDHLSTIAHHFYEAAARKSLTQAIEYSVLAGNWSSQCLAYEDAAFHYERAVELIDLANDPDEQLRCSLLLRQGDHLTKAGAREAARRPFDRATRLASRLGLARFLAEAALSASPGLLALESGVVDGFVIELAEGALSSLGAGHPDLRAKLLARLSLALHWSDDHEMVRRLATDSLAIARTCDEPEAVAGALQAMWSAAHGPENLNERASIASELECATTERVAPETQLVSQLFTLYSLLERGSIEAFDRKADVFRATAVQLQQPQGLWYAAMLDGMRALLRGDFDKGAQLAENFAALGKKANDANAAHSALAHAALICFERGDLVTIIPAAESMARQYPSVVVWRAALSWMLALAGRRDQAIAVMNSIGAERLSSLPKRMDWSGTLALLGEAAALAGDIGSARHLYEQLEPLRKSCVIHGLCTLSWGSAARVMGLLSECLGYLDRAVAELEDAVALNSDIGALPWVAHSQVALARVLMRRSTKAATLREAKGLLSQAVATTQALRMTNLEKVARQMLPSAR